MPTCIRCRAFLPNATQFCEYLGLIILATFFSRISKTLLFWIAFVLTRGRVAMEQKLRLGEKSIESISYRARLTSKAGFCGQQR